MIQVRLALSEDKTVISMLINKLFKEIGHTGLNEKSIALIYNDLYINRQIITVFIATDKDNPIGVISVSESAGFYAEGFYGVINELYVLPEYRSKGTGKLLIDKVKKFGKTRNWTRIEVTTPDRIHWNRTVRFYEKENFVEIGPRLKFEFHKIHPNIII